MFLLDMLYTICIFAFWISLGMTEGYKWTNTPFFVTAKNYHIIRAITNLSVILLIILDTDMSWFNLILKNLAAWSTYEMALNKVNHGEYLKQKDDFVFGEKVFKHPPVLLIPIIGLIAFFMSLSF